MISTLSNNSSTRRMTTAATSVASSLLPRFLCGRGGGRGGRAECHVVTSSKRGNVCVIMTLCLQDNLVKIVVILLGSSLVKLSRLHVSVGTVAPTWVVLVQWRSQGGFTIASNTPEASQLQTNRNYGTGPVTRSGSCDATSTCTNVTYSVLYCTQSRACYVSKPNPGIVSGLHIARVTYLVAITSKAKGS